MNPARVTINLPDDAATQRLGAALGAQLQIGDVVLLSGDLGAGKTTLCRGLLIALCGAREVPSPTYTLLQTYSGPRFDIWHFDLYRIKTPSEIWELGIEEAYDEGVCLIEWPQMMEHLRPKDALEITITFDAERRIAGISGPPQWAARLAALKKAFKNV